MAGIINKTIEAANRRVATFKSGKITVIAITAIFLCIGGIAGWYLYTFHRGSAIQSSGSTVSPDSIDDIQIGEFFMKCDNIESGLTGKWTNFRGAKSDNIIVAPETINTSGDNYPVLWTVETGEGYAAPVIYNGRVYLLDYDEALNSDALRCFSLETGKELWRRWYRAPIPRLHGFSRTAPVVGENYIITIGPQCHVMSCHPITGELKWSLDMQKEFEIETPRWYAGQCPLVDGNTLILAPAGEKILLAGFDLHTGEMIWSTPNTPGYEMSHSSVMLMTFYEKKTYVYVGEGGVCGISAEEYDRGTLLWETSAWQPPTIAPSPVQITVNQFFMCAGYGMGGALFQLDRQSDRWVVSIIEQYKPNEGLSSELQTPIFYNNMLISVIPKDGGTLRNRLACYSPSNLHTPLWTSNADERIGSGPYVVINNHLFAFSENCIFYVYEILQQGMRLIKKQPVMDGINAWTPLAYADGILIVSDVHAMKALKII